MTNDDANRIAAALTPGQRSTILGLDADPAILGCAEPTAIRLTKPVRSRPALTVQTPGGDEWPHEFALNLDGLAVKAALERIAA